jgi:hypothetical protein
LDQGQKVYGIPPDPAIIQISYDTIRTLWTLISQYGGDMKHHTQSQRALLIFANLFRGTIDSEFLWRTVAQTAWMWNVGDCGVGLHLRWNRFIPYNNSRLNAKRVRHRLKLDCLSCRSLQLQVVNTSIRILNAWRSSDLIPRFEIH